MNNPVVQVKEIKEILEKTRMRASEMVETAKKDVSENARNVFSQIEEYRRSIEPTIEEFLEFTKIVEEAPRKLQKKVTASRNRANLMVTRMNTAIANTRQKKDKIKAEAEKRIRETEEGSFPREELDRVKEESDQKLKWYDSEIEEAVKLLEEQKEKSEKEIEELAGRYAEKVQEARGIYEDGKGQIEAAVNAVNNVEERLKKICDEVKKEAKRIVRENVNDFVDEAQSQVMVCVMDVGKMKSLSYNLSDTLFREVREAVPELGKITEGKVEGLEAEFKSIVANAAGLFDRVKLSVKEIAVILEWVHGSVGSLQWLKEGSEVEAAMIGETVVMYADLEDVEDGKNFTVKVCKKDYTTENGLLDTFNVESGVGKLELSWTVKYVEDSDCEESRKIMEEKVYSRPEYVFVIESEELEIREESPVLECKDWIELKFIHKESGDLIKDMEFTVIDADSEEYKGKIDDKGVGRIEKISPGRCTVILGEDEFDYEI